MTSPNLNYFIIAGAMLIYVSIYFYLMPATSRKLALARCVVGTPKINHYKNGPHMCSCMCISLSETMLNPPSVHLCDTWFHSTAIILEHKLTLLMAIVQGNVCWWFVETLVIFCFWVKSVQKKHYCFSISLCCLGLHVDVWWLNKTCGVCIIIPVGVGG